MSLGVVVACADRDGLGGGAVMPRPSSERSEFIEGGKPTTHRSDRNGMKGARTTIEELRCGGGAKRSRNIKQRNAVQVAKKNHDGAKRGRGFFIELRSNRMPFKLGDAILFKKLNYMH